MTPRLRVYLCMLTSLSFVRPCIAQGPDFVSLVGRQFMLSGQEFYPRVLNYTFEIASNVDGSTDPDDLYATVEADYDFNVGQIFECDNENDCNTQIEEHFAKVVSMGFNTIRIVRFHPSMRKVGATRSFTLRVKHHSDPWGSRYPIDLPQGTYTDAVSERYFELLQGVLDLAHQEGLKVILLCTDKYPDNNGAELFYPGVDIDAADMYASYLTKLGEEIADHPALLAYDLWNEPAWPWDGPMAACTKSEVCDYTTLWFDAINTHDHNHLVTLGGASFYDLGAWDPTVMKLDFYSPHAYPSGQSRVYPSGLYYDPSFMDNEVSAELYWLAGVSPMPYLVGETGFAANDDVSGAPDFLDNDPTHHQMPWMHGTESQQSSYAASTLAATRAYMGSGYSWWVFQDVYYIRIPWVLDPNLELKPGDYRGNFYGLLKYGNGVDPWQDKPAVSVFQAFLPSPVPSVLPPPPANGHNWFMFNHASLNRSWFLKDLNSKPITDAIVKCQYHYYNTPYPGGPDSEKKFTLTNIVVPDEVGEVTIKGSPIVPDHYVSEREIDVYIPGSAEALHYTTINDWPVQGWIVYRDRERMFFDDVQNDLSVGVGDYEDVKAWNSLDCTNGIVDGTGSAGGAADLHARQAVHLGGEFHAQMGCEVHIWNEETFPNCSSPSYQGMTQNPTQTGGPAVAAERRSGLNQIGLQFEQRLSGFSVFPNPTDDAISVQLPGAGGSCTIFSSNGTLLREVQVVDIAQLISLSDLAPAQYLVKLAWQGQSYQQTITLVP